MKVYNIATKQYEELRCDKFGELISADNRRGYYEGKEFRTFFDIAGATASIKVLKFVSPINFSLHLQQFVLNLGELTFEAAVGGTEGGSFNTALPLIGTNRTNERPDTTYTPQVTITTGGTHTGGTVVELVKVKSGGNANLVSSVGGSLNDDRMLPPGTYYLRFTAVDETKGVYALRWEERP